MLTTESQFVRSCSGKLSLVLRADRGTHPSDSLCANFSYLYGTRGPQQDLAVPHTAWPRRLSHGGPRRPLAFWSGPPRSSVLSCCRTGKATFFFAQHTEAGTKSSTRLLLVMTLCPFGRLYITRPPSKHLFECNCKPRSSPLHLSVSIKVGNGAPCSVQSQPLLCQSSPLSLNFIGEFPSHIWRAAAHGRQPMSVSNVYPTVRNSATCGLTHSAPRSPHGPPVFGRIYPNVSTKQVVGRTVSRALTTRHTSMAGPHVVRRIRYATRGRVW